MPTDNAPEGTLDKPGFHRLRRTAAQGYSRPLPAVAGSYAAIGDSFMDVNELLISSFNSDTLGLGGAGGISPLQIVMLVLGVGGVTVVMISTRRRIRNSQRLPRTPTKQRYAELEKQARAGRSLEQVMLELDQLARQVHGRIDTQLAKLEAIIRNADQRIDKLSRLVRAADGEPTLDVTADCEDPHAAPLAASKVEDSRDEPVFRLADSGRSPIDIARQIGKTTGEIELILALRKTKNEGDRASARLTPDGLTADA